MYTPSSGCSHSLSFLPSGWNSYSSSHVSIGSVYLRAKFCSAPVRNEGWKKKPENQKTAGLPLSSQSWKKASRSSRSTTYPASGFRFGYDDFIHRSGTKLTARDLPTESSSADMMTRPLSASRMSLSVLLTTVSSLLKRSSSCVSTVFMLSCGSVGYFFLACSMLKLAGSLPRMSLQISTSRSSPPEHHTD